MGFCIVSKLETLASASSVTARPATRLIVPFASSTPWPLTRMSPPLSSVRVSAPSIFARSQAMLTPACTTMSPEERSTPSICTLEPALSSAQPVSPVTSIVPLITMLGATKCSSEAALAIAGSRPATTARPDISSESRACRYSVESVPVA